MERSKLILKIIKETPGIHTRGIIKESKLENGVVEHHLRKLEKQGKIKSQKRSRYRRYYTAEVYDDEFPVIRNMRKPTKKEILFNIMIQGNPSFKDLTIKLQKSPSTISWNISELIDEGIIEKCKLNGKQVYRIKNRDLFKKTFQKEFKKLFNEGMEHAEDIFLAL